MTLVFIHYFSGTGNTKRAVDRITEYLEKNGFEVKQMVISKNKPAISENAAFNIFAFPVLSWSAPGFTKKYIRRLPAGGGAKAAVCAVCAGIPFQALQNTAAILKRKQFDVFLTGYLIYPNNWIHMMNPPEEADQFGIIDKGDRMALDFAASFAREEHRLFKSGRIVNFITGFLAVVFALIGSRYFGKCYIADRRCNQCGICVKACPVNTISLLGMTRKQPYWNFRCQGCARCINLCPEHAIQVSIPRLLLHFIIIIGNIWMLVPLSGFTVHSLPPVYQIPGRVIAFIAGLAVARWIQFTVIDRLFFLLEQIPGVHRFFEWSFTRKFRRYTAPGFKPLSLGK
jgi:Pyruvate/2-oxoacid:ferredoxin oxidoreductase delta subunit